MKFGCEDEVDNDGGNDNSGCDDDDDDDGGVDINDGNDANDDDSISKTDCDDDANGGGGKTIDDGGVDDNGVFYTKGGDETLDVDEQTENVAGDLTKCNRSSKMEMRM